MFNLGKKNETDQSGAIGSGMQEYVDIAEIKDGIVVLKDGSLRAVLAVSSINFDLKSSTEQEAIIFGFQRFLNSLDFPLQIMVSTRRFNIRPYIQDLEKKRMVERNPLLRDQIGDYVNFVSELVNVANITSKSFFVIVSFYPVENQEKNILEKIMLAANHNKAVFQKREAFQTNRSQLLQRVGEVREALSITGLKAAKLTTQELVELYYNFYNPSEFEQTSLASIEDLMLERV